MRSRFFARILPVVIIASALAACGRVPVAYQSRASIEASARGESSSLLNLFQISRIPREIVPFAEKHPAGTIVVNSSQRRLYYVLGNGQAIRYGIGVGRDGFRWSGVHTVTSKREWPDWTPPAQMLQRQPTLPRHMEGGPENPLGARAIYLGSTLFRIHGSNEEETIGEANSSGCFRLTNADVIDLYSRVKVGSTVIVKL